MAGKPKKPTQQSLDKALDLLETLSKLGTSMSVADIAKSIKVTRVTAYSMINSLHQRHFIEKDNETGRYSIGYKIYDMAMCYRHKYPFLYVAENHINVMAEKWKIRINVCVLKEPGVAVLVLTKDASLLPRMILGYVMPCYASASGKLLMAYAPDDLRESLLDQLKFTAYTSKTLMDKNSLKDEMALIKSQGFATENEELMLQRCCVAAPVFDASGQVIASVSFSGSKKMFNEKKSDLTESIIYLSQSISSDLGYLPSIPINY